MKIRDFSGRSYKMAPRIDPDFLAMRREFERGKYEPVFPELFENDTLLGEDTARSKIMAARGIRVIRAFRELGVRLDQETQDMSHMIETLMNHFDKLRTPDYPELLPEYLAKTYDLYPLISGMVRRAEGWKLYPTTHQKEDSPDPTPTPPTDGGEPYIVAQNMDSIVHSTAYGLRDAA